MSLVSFDLEHILYVNLKFISQVKHPRYATELGFVGRSGG